jgi:hypothetical protein
MLAPVAANAFLLNQAIEALRAYSLVQRDPRAHGLRNEMTARKQ